MKNVLTPLFLVCLLLSHVLLFPALESAKESRKTTKSPWMGLPKIEVKKEAFEILKNKCNVCHRKQNPFKIFSLKNMDKNASKIYQQVFVKRRMPKGDNIKLTNQEYQTLENWLNTHNLN